jgi:glycosyltransferase involved in cell wall biosynthesis
MPRTNQKKRILLLGDARQVHLHRWSRYLSDVGFEVLGVSLEPTDAMPGACERIRVPRVLPDFMRYPAATPAIRRLIGRFEPDVVNAHFLPNYGVIAALSGFDPWVLSTWGSDIMLLPQKSAFHMRRTRFVIRRATHITSDAEVMSKRLVEVGADPTRVITFPFGVDRDVFHPSEIPVSRDRPRILSNRKIEPVYNIETIILAVSEVIRSVPGARLTVAGTGSARRKLENDVRRGKASESIRFTGDVPHSEVPELLRDHDIFVSVALSDTTSVSLLEAMACGLFPVVSDIPANREWIEHGRNGFVVPARDFEALSHAIVDAWNRPQLRESAKKINADLIETRADWYRNMSSVRELFDRLASSNHTSHTS